MNGSTTSDNEIETIHSAKKPDDVQSNELVDKSKEANHGSASSNKECEKADYEMNSNLQSDKNEPTNMKDHEQET